MNWKEATRAQLCEIAYNDEEAPLKYRIAAADELKRRSNRKHARLQNKERKVYPR